MKMTDEAFDAYFSKTIWRGEKSIPQLVELQEMEQKFMDVLAEQKRIGMKDGSYFYLFSDNGKKLISRIGFCKNLINDGKGDKAVNTLLSSYERLRLAMKCLDRNLYEKELRKGINKSKAKQRENRIKDAHPKSIKTQVKQDEAEDSIKEQRTESLVISGTQGLADYLGCSKSMAFSVIKKGILKEEGIQYMVGKCWKFNRKKLDEHLEHHPEMLSKIRCKY